MNKYKRAKPSPKKKAKDRILMDDKAFFAHPPYEAPKSKARSQKTASRYQKNRDDFCGGAEIFSSQQRPGYIRAKAWMRRD